MVNMRIAVAALVCLCMVALTYAQGGVIGRTCRGPQCRSNNIGEYGACSISKTLYSLTSYDEERGGMALF
uniref:Putative secreted protein n=1 Tax=Amblyomma triste TaxID=251400 RepID=A0A023FZM9_AMBTT